MMLNGRPITTLMLLYIGCNLVALVLGLVILWLDYRQVKAFKTKRAGVGKEIKL